MIIDLLLTGLRCAPPFFSGVHVDGKRQVRNDGYGRLLSYHYRTTGLSLYWWKAKMELTALAYGRLAVVIPYPFFVISVQCVSVQKV